MNEMKPNLPPELQKALQEYYSSPLLPVGFASRLEMELRQNIQRQLAGSR